MKIVLFLILVTILSACATIVDKRECRKNYLDNHLNDLDNVLKDSEDKCT